jgi:hypothetical protein
MPDARSDHHRHEPFELAADGVPLDCIDEFDTNYWGMDVCREVGFETCCERVCVESRWSATPENQMS